jgi:hypothetical protein
MRTNLKIRQQVEGLLTPAGRGHRPLFMILVGLSADPLAKKLVALKAIAVHYRRLGSQNGDPG